MKSLILITILMLCFTNVHAWLPERYHTYAEVEQEIFWAAEQFPDIISVDTLGYAHDIGGDDTPIFVVKISDNVQENEDEPSLLFTGAHHAEEIIGVEICMYIMQRLVMGYGVNDTITQWVNDAESWFVPVVNPLGHQVVVDSLDYAYRKNKRDNNLNGSFDVVPGIGADTDGVDLNRNYDYHWSHGDTLWESDNYRGPSPFSESETQAIRNFIANVKPALAVNYHSSRTGDVAEMVIHPWNHNGEYCPDMWHIQEVAYQVSERIPTDDGEDTYEYVIGSGMYGYARDWMYGVHGVFAMTIEAGSTVLPPGDMVDDICERNWVGIQFLYERVRYAAITGNITDVDTGEPLEANVRILEAYDPDLPERKSEPIFGRYIRLLEPWAAPFTVEISKDEYETVTIDSVLTSYTGLTELDVELQWQDPTAVEEESIKSISDIKMSQNYPNPFNSKTAITIELPETQPVELSIYDISGKLNKNLVDRRLESGNYQFNWNGKDNGDKQMPSGIYFYVLKQGESECTKQMIYLK